MPMNALCGLPLFFVVLAQAADIPPLLEDILDPGERIRLEHASNIDRRIKVYDSVSKRIQKDIRGAVSKDEYETVPENLRQWIVLLSVSLKDIEQNLKGRKKPKSLKNYEIHVRKAISDAENFRISAPLNQQDAIKSYLNSAEDVRKRIMDLLFEQ
jgi:hypothetical protein